MTMKLYIFEKTFLEKWWRAVHYPSLFWQIRSGCSNVIFRSPISFSTASDSCHCGSHSLLKIPLGYFNGLSLWLSTCCWDAILCRREAARVNKLLLQIIYSHNLGGPMHRPTWCFPASLISLLATDKEAVRISFLYYFLYFILLL